MNNNALLQIESVTKRFGGLLALDEVSLSVKESEIFGIIGPNGAGKSTLLAQISGLQQPTSGKIIFNNHDITGMEAHQIAALGIGRNFQASLLFKELSVLENVFTGYHMVYQSNMLKRFFRLSSARNEEHELKQKAAEVLEFMGLGSVKDELAKNLPHGYQRILTVCIAMATDPKLLLLDEPVTGMNLTEMNVMVDLIRQIRNRGLTIILIEHNMETIMKVCDRIMVLSYGEKIAEGLPKEIQNNPQVIEAYLGKE